jgi:hypothetical protein
MNDLLRKNNDQPTNNIDVSCVQTVGLKHAKGLFVLLETNFFTTFFKSRYSAIHLELLILEVSGIRI